MMALWASAVLLWKSVLLELCIALRPAYRRQGLEEASYHWESTRICDGATGGKLRVQGAQFHQVLARLLRNVLGRDDETRTDTDRLRLVGLEFQLVVCQIRLGPAPASAALAA